MQELAEADPVGKANASLQDEYNSMNNKLSTQSRELKRKGTALLEAQTSYERSNKMENFYKEELERK